MNDRVTSIERTRVIGVYAHIDAGKTTTSEAILYYTGRIHRTGSVDDGTTQLDWMEQERARYHHHRCRHDLLLARSPHQSDRHARPH